MTATCGLTAYNPRLASTGCNELIACPFTLTFDIAFIVGVLCAYRLCVLITGDEIDAA